MPHQTHSSEQWAKATWEMAESYPEGSPEQKVMHGLHAVVAALGQGVTGDEARYIMDQASFHLLPYLMDETHALPTSQLLDGLVANNVIEYVGGYEGYDYRYRDMGYDGWEPIVSLPPDLEKPLRAAFTRNDLKNSQEKNQ